MTLHTVKRRLVIGLSGRAAVLAVLLLSAAGRAVAAPTGRGAAGAAGAAGHWAYQPLRKPPVPAGAAGEVVANPVDAFVRASLAGRGIKPSPQADRRTLVRRVYFDLTGLPPTPEEVASFVGDCSEDAYEKLVDRLLASPRYGERWARHWMDVVHFAESHGHDQDRPRPHAWPYRDYLIRSFNADKPYGRFVEEQVAGDVLYPDDPDGVVALGFIAAGPWDESSQMAIMEDTVDKKIAKYLDRDDMVATTLSTFASSTVHCARCHDHKFDPIKQDEYYALQAVFAGVDRANRPYDPDPQVHGRRRELLARKAALPSMTDASLLAANVQADAAAWEKARADDEAAWTVLDPASFASAGGATPAKQPDGSILFGGPRPDKDTYTVQGHTTLRTITAVRLEVLTDDSLPRRGPGRAENGNLHLTEFKLLAAPAAPGAAVREVVFRSAVADFSQDHFAVAGAIDGKPETEWAVHPAEGKRHVAVFELKEPLTADSAAATALTFTLVQSRGGSHLIGRPRFSVTYSTKPPLTPPLPEELQAIVATPTDRRTDPQRAALARHATGARIDADLAALPPQQTVFAAASDFPAEGNFKPAGGCREVHVLRRGDVNAPLQPAAPGALSCVPGLSPTFVLPDPGSESARRAALAKWLSDGRNVLTWRSIANRVWHYHFGRGIVDTPNDLGRMGGEPSHPELLDYLATYLLEQGGSLKQLHRLIVTSATYRQSSAHHDAHAKIDADNRLLWRMNRTRLDAESVRDAVLQMSGTLDLAMGGPSVKQYAESPGIHVTPDVNYAALDLDGPAARRRSVYRFVMRTVPDPFMETMDCADASQLTPARSSSVTALQALSMLNNRFIVRYSEHLAARVEREEKEVPRQIERLYELALNRPPTADEVAAVTAHVSKHGLANACRLILNSNEFMFVN